jgi:tetratricopeptide (TPR) repeat protein
MMAGHNSRIFISYARADGGEFASELQGRLAAAGFPTWFDAVDIPAGSDWDEEIDQGLRAAGAVLVVLTPGAVLSRQVKGEWSYALNRLLPVIPLLARDCEVPRVLSVLQHLDFRTDPEAAFVRLIDRLRDLPRAHLAELGRLRDAFRAARREGPEAARFDAKVADLEAVIGGWEGRFQAQRDRIAQGLERAHQTVADAWPSGARKTRVAGDRPLDVSDIFKGRDREQQAVGRLLAGGQARLVSILGRGGMGKTALACHVLRGIEQGRWPHADRGPTVEGIAYLSTRTAGITLERLFLDCARLLDSRQLEKTWADPSLDANAKITRLLEALEHGTYIVLLDNLEDLLDADGRLSDPELASFFGQALGAPGHGLRLLVTSRVALQLSPGLQRHDHHLALGNGLGIPEGIQLLRELDPNGEWGVGNAPEAKLAEVVRRTHGVPRALELVVAIMADNVFLTLDDVVGDFYNQDEIVRRLVEENYRLLNDAARRVVEALAVYAVPVPQVALDYLLELSAPGLDLPTVFRQLTRSHLVHIDRGARTAALHPIDQEYLYERLPQEGAYSRRVLHARAAEYYGRLCAAGPADDNEHIELLSHQFEHLRRAGRFEEAAELLGELGPWIVFRGSASRAQEMARSLTGRVTGDRGRLGLLRCEVAVTNMLGPLDRALAIGERAIDLARRLGAVREEAQIETVLGNICRYLADTARAIDHFGRALELSRRAGDAEAEVRQLGNLGLCHGYLGNVREALRYGQLLLQRAGQSGSAHDQLSAHDVLGLTYFVWGRWDEAIRHCEAVLGAWHKGMHDGKAYALNTAGLAHFLAGRQERARAVLREGRAVARELESPRAEGFCLRNLALVHYLTGSVEEARGPATEAHAILSRLGLASVSAPVLGVLDAAASGNLADEPRALLECADRSADNPDLFPAGVLATRARDLACAAGLGDLASRARGWLSQHSARLVLPDE